MSYAHLTELRLTAFKSFRDQVLPIDPTTVLIGRNGSGKSNALDALDVLARLANAQDIKDALEVLPHNRPLTAGDWRRLSETWRRELDERIARLTALRDHLDGCIGCGCLSMQDCPLRNPQDVLAGEGAGAHLLEE